MATQAKPLTKAQLVTELSEKLDAKKAIDEAAHLAARI